MMSLDLSGGGRQKGRMGKSPRVRGRAFGERFAVCDWSLCRGEHGDEAAHTHRRYEKIILLTCPQEMGSVGAVCPEVWVLVFRTAGQNNLQAGYERL